MDSNQKANVVTTKFHRKKMIELEKQFDILNLLVTLHTKHIFKNTLYQKYLDKKIADKNKRNEINGNTNTNDIISWT